MDRSFKKQDGFTLIEILIVVILLGIIATIIIPQVSDSNDDAKLNTLKTNLQNLRGAIDLYYYQHNNAYPGAKKKKGDGEDEYNPDHAATAFLEQLTRYTNVLGKTGKKMDESKGIIIDPYLKSDELSINHYNGKNDVKCDTTTTDITAGTSDGSTGFKFYTKTGVLLANDGSHDNL